MTPFDVVKVHKPLYIAVGQAPGDRGGAGRSRS